MKKKLRNHLLKNVFGRNNSCHSFMSYSFVIPGFFKSCLVLSVLMFIKAIENTARISISTLSVFDCLRLWGPLHNLNCPVGWGCRIHRLLLCRGVRPPWVSWYDTKQSDDEVPAMLELWGMKSIPLLPSLPCPLSPGVVAPDKGPIYGLNRTKPCFLHYTDFCI